MKKRIAALGRSTAEQVMQGTPIDVSQIRPGDLLFYADAAGNVEHGAIYIGKNPVKNF